MPYISTEKSIERERQQPFRVFTFAFLLLYSLIIIFKWFLFLGFALIF